MTLVEGSPMTEEEWLAATEPTPLLDYLRGKANGRKHRLFAVACCRCTYHSFLNPENLDALVIAERLSEGLLLPNERNFARKQAFQASWSKAKNCVAATLARSPGNAARQCALYAREVNLTLIRCVFGNPFRPVTLDRSWLTSNVVNLAQTIYDERDLPSGLFDHQRLGVLADALEEAGCDNADILGHLRSGGDHVRGCWAVDLVLSKS
jgi:hypothetical protein